MEHPDNTTYGANLNNPTYNQQHSGATGQIGTIALSIAMLMSVPAFAQAPFFAPGNLVVVVEGCGVRGGTCTAVPNGTGNGTGNSSVGGYGDNQAAPLTLFQYAPNGTSSVVYVNSLAFPQTGSGANLPVSGEYGSSSEGTLQLSGAGQYLSIMGYGINAATFDAAYYPGFSTDPYGAAPSGALAQSGSLTGQSYTPVARVLMLIDANGNVNSSTALYNIFNTNNPRSVYTADGTTVAYVSGQGSGCDTTGGVFYIPIGITTTSPTAITGPDAAATSSCLSSGGPSTINQDTRDVQIYNNTLYIAIDSTEGKSFNRSFIGTLGTPPATTLYVPGASDPYSTGPTMLTGFGNTGGTGKESITTGANSNGNGPNAGLQINLSPVNYFFANASTLYVADSGNPKNDSATSSLGDGGLQKWVNSKSNGSGTWSLAYTLYRGLNLVANTNADGSTGLYGLTGTVSGATVQLYATNYTLSDLDPTYLYGITDTLSYTSASQAAGEVFTLLDTAPSDSNFKGVSFPPTIPAGDVEITSSPSGLSFTSSGAGCAQGIYTTPVTLSWTPNSSCSLTAATPQTVAPGVQYAFTQWENETTSGATTNATFMVTAPTTTATYNATFAAVPVITWVPQYAAIRFGSALSDAELDATASFLGSPVPGTFVYDPPPGTVLLPGANQALSVTFTPTNTTEYTQAIGSTTITVVPGAASGPADLVVTHVLKRSGGKVVVGLTIANRGGAAADVVLTGVTVGSDSGTPLPQTLGTIPSGEIAQATVAVPGSVGAAGVPSSLTVSGTYTGGTFNSSSRITLP
jgi:hypothetical protein